MSTWWLLVCLTVSDSSCIDRELSVVSSHLVEKKFFFEEGVFVLRVLAFV